MHMACDDASYDKVACSLDNQVTGNPLPKEPCYAPLSALSGPEQLIGIAMELSMLEVQC